MKPLKTYILKDKENKIIDTFLGIDLKQAVDYFKYNNQGRFKIICGDLPYNVRF
jgi:hypothetical protein